MYFWNNKEEEIIGTFISNIDDYEDVMLTLKWKNGSEVSAIFDSYIEDENDYDIEDDNYEEFWSFVFKVSEVKGTPPIYVTEDKFFLINYHNFPDKIMANNTKIN